MSSIEQQRTDRVWQMIELQRHQPEVKDMVRIVLDAEGATSLAHLIDMAPEVFDDLAEMVLDEIVDLPHPGAHG